MAAVTTDKVQDSARTRALMPDYLRLIALFGIVVVNVQYIAFSVFKGTTPQAAETTADAMTLVLVNGLALLKSYGLFSFMFGVGLGFLIAASARRDLPFGKVYRNRMIGLLFLGLAHGLLFFPGDILVVYAITGALLYRWRSWDVRKLVKYGAVLILVQTLIVTALGFFEEAPEAKFMQFEQAAVIGDGVMDAVIFRSIGFAVSLPFLLFMQGLGALGWFCLGLAAVRSGMIDDRHHPLWQRARRLCLIPGVALSLLSAAIWQWGSPMWGSALTVLFAPVATLGYLGLIAAIARPPGACMSHVLRAGGASLTIYLSQSIILSTIFSGYGFGLWGQLDHLSATLVAIAVTAVMIVAMSFWCHHFRLGPFEMLLRRITYGRLTARRAITPK